MISFPSQATPDIDFDWDDDLILQFTNDEVKSGVNGVAAGSGPMKLGNGVDDPKLARKEKINKLLKSPPPPERSVPVEPKVKLRQKQLRTRDLSWALNELATEFYKETLPQMPAVPYIPCLPLYLYDDSSLEALATPEMIIANGTVEGETEASLQGSALFAPDSSLPESSTPDSSSSPYHSIIGTFKRVLITGYNQEVNMFEGMWYDTATMCTVPRVSGMCVCVCVCVRDVHLQSLGSAISHLFSAASCSAIFVYLFVLHNNTNPSLLRRTPCSLLRG